MSAAPTRRSSTSKYDVEDAIENYYELGADKVVAKKKKNDSNIIWPDDWNLKNVS